MWIGSQLAEWVRVARAERMFPPPTGGPVLGLPAPRDFDSQIATGALDAAIELIGQGETTNNAGPFVEMLIAPAKAPQNWCAAFVGFCYLRSAMRQGMTLPFKRSLGAKRLGENVAAVGRKFTDPAEAKPGDLMVFHRGDQGSWMGHVAIVESADYGTLATFNRRVQVHTVEGNAGPKVMRCVREVERDRFAYFASLRRG